MKNFPFLLLLAITLIISCNMPSNKRVDKDQAELIGKGALLTTRFDSFEEFKSLIQIEYETGRKPLVRLTYANDDQIVTSILKAGISQADIIQIRTGNFWGKIGLCFRSPFFVIHRQDVMRVYVLGRRRHNIFGWRDVAFYDLAETMMDHIIDVGVIPIDSSDFSEKGYINTFNHISSQAFMTTLFSEKLADFISHTHERSTMPELITGDFTEEQISDINNGAVDNYVDFINNEWGQELGKLLREKYNISRQTIWTPQLLSDYLNDLQLYYSEVLQIGFKPYSIDDYVVIKFSDKINKVMNELSSMRGI